MASPMGAGMGAALMTTGQLAAGTFTASQIKTVDVVLKRSFNDTGFTPMAWLSGEVVNGKVVVTGVVVKDVSTVTVTLKNTTLSAIAAGGNVHVIAEKN